MPDHLADLLARAPELKNVIIVAAWTTFFWGGLGYQGEKNILFLKMFGFLALVPQASQKIAQYKGENFVGPKAP